MTLDRDILESRCTDADYSARREAKSRVTQSRPAGRGAGGAARRARGVCQRTFLHKEPVNLRAGDFSKRGRIVGLARAPPHARSEEGRRPRGSDKARDERDGPAAKRGVKPIAWLAEARASRTRAPGPARTPPARQSQTRRPRGWRRARAFPPPRPQAA